VFVGFTISQHSTNALSTTRNRWEAVKRLSYSLIQRQTIYFHEGIDIPGNCLDGQARALENDSARYFAGHRFQKVASEPFVRGHEPNFTPIANWFKP
jgi:hypothetical protein